MGFWNWNINIEKKKEMPVQSDTPFNLATELELTSKELEKVRSFAEKNGKTKTHHVMAGEIRLYDPWSNEGYEKRLTDLQVHRRWNKQSLKDFAAMALREENT